MSCHGPVEQVNLGRRVLDDEEGETACEEVLAGADVDDEAEEEEEKSSTLVVLNAMRKICCAPSLLSPSKTASSGQWRSSGKLCVLADLLQRTRSMGSDRFVLISNFTSVLNIFSTMLKELSLTSILLDGCCPAHKRQALVDKFNDDESHFAFLLSSKAGGCGINLIGANRLVLFDPDWNPATDAQALARVWRSGQQKPCYMYRFFAAGSLEEKIYQRQQVDSRLLYRRRARYRPTCGCRVPHPKLCYAWLRQAKEGLSDQIVDDRMDSRKFSDEELKELFTRGNTLSTIHDSLGCRCCSHAEKALDSYESAVKDESGFAHLLPSSTALQSCDAALGEVAGHLSMCFVKKGDKTKTDKDEGKNEGDVKDEVE